MKTVILAAGEGSRLRDRFAIKPLAIVGGKTLIDHAIATARAAGSNEVVIVLGYEKEQIVRHLQDNASIHEGVSLRWVYNNNWSAGNAYSLLAVEAVLNDSDFLLTMCDHLMSPSILADLIALDRPVGTELILAIDRRLDNPLVDIVDVTRVVERDGYISAIGKLLPDYTSFDAGAFRLTPSVFGTLRALAAVNTSLGISDLVTKLTLRRAAAVHDIGDHFWIDVDDDRMCRLAEKHLERSQIAARSL